VEDKYGMKVEIIKDDSSDIDPEVMSHASCFLLLIQELMSGTSISYYYSN